MILWRRRDKSAAAGHTGQILPDGRIFGLTWTIPKEFGGLTNVLLHRSKTFAELDGRPVDILTLSSDLDVASTASRLSKSGKLGSSVRLRNLWDEIRNASDRELGEISALSSPALPVGMLLEYERRPSSKRMSVDGEVLQTDFFRRDGSRVASDERDVSERGKLGGRRITLFSRSGNPVGQWNSASGLYFAWLDYVIGVEPAFLISDSQFVGGFLSGYRRDNVVVAQVIHNSHLPTDATSLFAPLAQSKRQMIERLDSYDLVAALTDRQRADLVEANLAGRNVRAIPNSRTIGATVVGPRDPRTGVMVARLGRQKRVDHAIEAMARVRDAGVGATLAIYGDGEHRPQLENLVESLDLGGTVRLKGYDSGAAQRFGQASFSVLSSRFEGMPLVLVESMAAGCIPIAYDVRYGPADIIADGIDGFLVPAGDVEALGRAICRVATMPEDELSRMRLSAVQRARDFDDEAVTRIWADELLAARARKRPVRDLAVRCKARAGAVTDDGVSFVGSITGPLSRDSCDIYLTWRGRRHAIYGRIAAEKTNVSEGRVDFSAQFPWGRIADLPNDVLDFFVDVIEGGNVRRIRISADGARYTTAHGSERTLYVTQAGNVSLRLARGA